MTTTIQEWLYNDRQPADLYDLLGCLRFDPDRRQLLAAVRLAFAELQPYQNHEDRQIAQRAVQLQIELARAENILSNPDKLRLHHCAILSELRQAYQKEIGRTLADSDFEPLQSWLKQQSVHSDRLELVARSLSTPQDETVELTFHDTQEIERDAEKPATEGYVLQEEDGLKHRPGDAGPSVFRSPSAETLPQASRSPGESPPPIMAELVETDTTPRHHQGRLRPPPRRSIGVFGKSMRQQQFVFSMIAAILVWLLLMLIAWVVLGT